jgi:hypothetical protein
VSADQDYDYTYIVSNGEAIITDYTGAGEAITIPSTLGGYKTVAIEDYAFESCTSLTAVTIPNCVTTIGQYAFYHCSSLISMSIPDSVTTIGQQAFYNCSSLTSVNIPDSVTTIERGTFCYCSSLTSVNIQNSVNTIENGAFYSCSSLTSVTIGNSVTTIKQYAFYYCSSLISITFLGVVAPAIVDSNWIQGTPYEIRGHAYVTSNFPAPGEIWHGLTMGMVLSGSGRDENDSPLAGFSWMPSNPNVNQMIIFDASASSVPNGSITLYEWDWNNDGKYEESYSTPTKTHLWTQSGNYSVTVRVTDNSGDTSTITKTVNLGSGNKSPDSKTPGFELILILLVIAMILFLKRKRKK